MKIICRLLLILLVVSAAAAVLVGAGYILGPEDAKPVVALVLFGMWTLLVLNYGVRLGKSSRGSAPMPGAPSFPPIQDPTKFAEWLKNGDGPPPLSTKDSEDEEGPDTIKGTAQFDM